MYKDPILTQSNLVLAKMETVVGQDSLPDAVNDSILAIDADYSVDTNVLARNISRPDLSPLKDKIGRKLASLSFGVELKSNGTAGSGLIANAPRIGRLLRACGFSEAAVSAVAGVGAILPDANNTKNPAWAVGGNTNGNANKGDYKATVVLGGASAAAKVRVTGGIGLEDVSVLPSERYEAAVQNPTTAPQVTIIVNKTNPLAPTFTFGGTFQVGDIVQAFVGGVEYYFPVTSSMVSLAGIATYFAALLDAHALLIGAVDGGNPNKVNVTFAGSAAGVVVTSGATAVALGSSGGTITPAWTGNLVLNEFYSVSVYPPGIRYLPVSANFETITLYFYAGNVLHKMSACQGTFTIAAEAGNYGRINFTFTGQYAEPVNAPLPNPTYEGDRIDPPTVELAHMLLGDYFPIVNAFNYTQGNTITPRPSVNHKDGYFGTRVTGRSPEGGIDPEANLVNDINFWTAMANAIDFRFSMKVGAAQNALVLLNAPVVQYTKATYQSRDGIRTYDMGLKFNRLNGNDEFELFFG